VHLFGGLAVASIAFHQFLDPTLEPYMRGTLGITSSQVSYVNMLKNASFSITSVIVGWISVRYANKLTILFVGHIIFCIAFLLLGPSFLLPIDPAVWLSVLGVAMIGVSHATTLIPTFESMLKITM
jgi:hypothetical protein